MPYANGRPHGSTNEDMFSTHCSSGWAFSPSPRRLVEAVEVLDEHARIRLRDNPAQGLIARKRQEARAALMIAARRTNR